MTTELFLEYKGKKTQIKNRLEDFRKLLGLRDEDLFAELCFCIFTPQAKAVVCDQAVKNLKTSGLLLKGSKNEIKSKLKGVRFPNNKAGYLIDARKLFCNGNNIDIKSRIDKDEVLETREWFVRNVKGLGYKEASHFLRNIGLGKDIAILDVHILRNLKRYGVIKKIPKSVSKKVYIDIENEMKSFSKKMKIPMQDLDLLFWSKETGIIFK